MSIEVRGITKRFGAFTALRDLSLTVPEGELVALLGPSGSGKTSLLRIIAGLDLPDAGSVHFDGEDATARHVRERRVGFVFQHYALFRHMTVFENIAFGLRVRPRETRPAEEEIRRRVTELLAMVQLEPLAHRCPSQLSGGQRQRVALARALAVEPKVLLLDEPFGSLDARVRSELRRELRRLHDQLRITSVFVTHDQEEALEVADRVVVMNEGRIEQYAPPEEVWERPANPFVYRFLGDVNLLRGRLAGGRLDIGGVSLPAPGDAGVGDGEVLCYVRTHDLEVFTGPDDGGAFRTTVLRAVAAGARVKLELRLGATGEEIEAELDRGAWRALDVPAGGRLLARPRAMRLFPAGV